MADPSGKNNQPRREGSDEDEKANKTSKSGEPERPKLVAVRRLQQQQRRRRCLQSRPPPPPTLGEVAARALTVARQFLQQRGRALLKLPLGRRLLFLADKARSCVMQALRWAVPRHLTQQHEEDIVLPASPLGLDIGRRVKSILWSIGAVVRTAREFLDLQLPRYREVADRIFLYRRELEDLKPARPHSVKSVQRSTAPRIKSAGQTFALWPSSTQAAGPAQTEAPGPSSAAVQQSEVKPAPQQSSSSSSSSSSASTGSITEEVVDRYYSPPRFIQGWTKREETTDEMEEKPEHDGQKDSEAQESDEQSASVAEEAAVVFALAPTPPPPPAGQGDGEPGAEAGAGGAQGQRPHRGIPKRLLFGLFGLKMA